MARVARAAVRMVMDIFASFVGKDGKVEFVRCGDRRRGIKRLVVVY